MGVYFYGGKLSPAKTESTIFSSGGTRETFSRATSLHRASTDKSYINFQDVSRTLKNMQTTPF